MIVQFLLYALVLLTAIPAGYVLAWLCKDELKDGRKWFKIILCSLAVVMIVSFVFYINTSIILSLAYMIIITLVSLKKSMD